MHAPDETLDAHRFYVYSTASGCAAADGGLLQAPTRVFRIRCYNPEIAAIVRDYGPFVRMTGVPTLVGFSREADSDVTFLTIGGAKKWSISHRMVSQTQAQIDAKKEPLIVSHLVCITDNERFELAEVFLENEPDGVDPVVRAAVLERDLSPEQIQHNALQEELTERFKRDV